MAADRRPVSEEGLPVPGGITPRMKIALIAPPWLPIPPPAYGGTEAVVDRLARGFAEAGHDVLLLASGDSTCPVPTASVIDTAESDRMGAAVPELRHVIHAYERAADYDVVHDHTVMGPVYASGKSGGPLVVTTNHGPFNDELSDIYRSIGGRIPIIAISHSQAATAVDVPIAGVIHHGIDTEAFPFGAGDGGYLLFLGRMVPEKGARRAALIAQLAGVPLLIAAKMREPLELQFYEEQVKPLLGNGVEYIGEVANGERLELLRGARALLNPIRWPEPFGLVMIEALACGTPVLTFAEGAAPEIVDDGVTGFVCDDEAAMVRAISKIDSLDRRACRAAAETRFSTARMVRDHLELFGRLRSAGLRAAA
jgi:glycosyltransferase involved in cell wall biosynthesis